MSDQIIIAFSETERVAQSLTQAGDNLFATHERLASSIETLYASGLQGAFLDLFVNNNRMLLNTLNTLAAETLESGTDLLRTVTNFRALDAECAAMFASYGLTGFSGGGGGGGGGGSWGADFADVDWSRFPEKLLYGSRLDLYTGFRVGNMSVKEIAKYLMKDPFAHGIGDYVDAKGTLYQRTEIGSTALSDSMSAGELGTLQRSLGWIEGRTDNWVGIDEHGFGYSSKVGVEASAARWVATSRLGDYDVQGTASLVGAEAWEKSNIAIGLDGVDIGSDTHAGVYLAKGQANVHNGAFDAAIQGELSASVDTSMHTTIDPFTGNVSAKANVEYFAGARVQSQQTWDAGLFKIGLQEQASAGVGAGGNANFGITDGIFHADLGAFATAGVGAGAGVVFDLDLVATGQAVGNIAEQGVDLLFAS